VKTKQRENLALFIDRLHVGLRRVGGDREDEVSKQIGVNMNFDEWCYSKEIKGNYKEALYHYILATRSGNKIDDPQEWAKAWSELLDEISKSMLAGPL
jgi:hypothetical protein